MLGGLLSTLGLAALKGEVTAMARRSAHRAALLAAAAVLWLTAFGFALAAVTVWLSRVLGVVTALAMVAAALAVVALVVHLILASTGRRPASSPRAGPAGPAGAATGESNSLVWLAGAGLAGYIIGRALSRD
jgi:hypothetical protein